MHEKGQREGAPYANWKVWPNTTHASRTLLLAQQHGRGAAFIGVLYRMCYEDGENVSLKETVAKAAEEAGVPGGKAYALSDAGREELHKALTEARVNGKRISAAPTFNVRIGQRATDLSGAQDTATWVSILEQCAAQG